MGLLRQLGSDPPRRLQEAVKSGPGGVAVRPLSGRPHLRYNEPSGRRRRTHTSPERPAMSSNTTERFDAIILGTGQGGKPLALALARAGWKTAVVERGPVGGTCVNVGCTPTKTMVASARVAYLARRAADYGVQVGPVQVDLARVRERKRALVESFRSGSQKK